MQKIKITAIRKADYKDLQKKYENPIQHACDIQEGHYLMNLHRLFVIIPLLYMLNSFTNTIECSSGEKAIAAVEALFEN